MKDKTYDFLSRQADVYGIIFRSPDPRNWPTSHTNTFEEIRSIRDQKFDDYCRADATPSGHRLRMHTKKRAESLANSAERLVQQRANEFEWRDALERDFLLRFHSEVACAKCRARIWKSDFEAYIDPSNDIDGLRERRKNRVLCKCEDFNSQNAFYDSGRTRLFGSRGERLVIHDAEVRKHLLRHKPDRVVGLQKTKAFETIFGKMEQDPGKMERTIKLLTPFTNQKSPLLLPFLILEAKAENSSDGFQNIGMQTAFPIWALLRWLVALRALAPGYSSPTSPLVWFVASRGDNWRVYGCCATEDKKYEIIQLWDGCITDKDCSLQFLLIIDYIFDWARDVYRPDILKQLESFATGVNYHLVRYSYDSDIESLCVQFRTARIESIRIGTTEQAPIVEETQGNRGDTGESMGQDEQASGEGEEGEEREESSEEDKESSEEDEESSGEDEESSEENEDEEGDVHDRVLPMPIPDTELGSLRSAHVFDARISGVRINKRNAEAMLRLAEGANGQKNKSQEAARAVLRFMERWDEIISLSEDDLNDLEIAWTGATCESSLSSKTRPTTTFYVLIEFATFMKDVDWTITKEITYFAVSKSALPVLLEAAAYKRRSFGVESIEDKIRQCSREVWRETVQCLRLGSPWQHFSAAVSCALFSLYPLPKREGEDHRPEVEALGFQDIAHSQLRGTVESYYKFGEEQEWNGLIPQRVKAWDDARDRFLARRLSARDGIPLGEGRTLVRVLDARYPGLEQRAHSDDSCRRCRRIDREFPDCYAFRRNDPPKLSKYGMALVEAVRYTSRKPHDWSEHDICLFAFDALSKADAIPALNVVVHDILRTGKVYHTIRHPLPHDSRDEEILWNLLPPYYCSLLEEQRRHVEDWELELQGLYTPPELNSDKQARLWDRLQILLYLLQKGTTYRRAVECLPAPEDADFNTWITSEAS